MKNRGFWLIAAAFFVTMLGTTLPTPLYPLYEKRFGFAPVVITVIFATYAVGVIAGLVLSVIFPIASVGAAPFCRDWHSRR